MRITHKKVSVEILSGLFGYTKQAYYQKEKRIYKRAVQEDIIIDSVKRIRKELPRLGARKLLVKLLDQGLQIGRDGLFDLLDRHALLVRRKRTQVRTTHSSHWLRKYPNLIRDLNVTQPNRLWVSDITYIETEQGFMYLFLITDAYSRKIVGYKVADNLQADNAILALKQAIKQLPKASNNLIHHSDRGIQYCCNKYVKILNKTGIAISMTQNGDPLENAIAERVNGILKVEWLYDQKLESFKDAQIYIKRIIGLYNSKRPHASIEMLTPDQAHLTTGELKRKWKNYYKVKNDNTVNME